mmetsp:Transcript_117113/g.343061  ORF Transcript_117113/g.343061 Transcript_117113/m.343061 type:complete len:256 (+) Transcript_117113:312-1079(+)
MSLGCRVPANNSATGPPGSGLYAGRPSVPKVTRQGTWKGVRAPASSSRIAATRGSANGICCSWFCVMSDIIATFFERSSKVVSREANVSSAASQAVTSLGPMASIFRAKLCKVLLFQARVTDRRPASAANAGHSAWSRFSSASLPTERERSTHTSLRNEVRSVSWRRAAPAAPRDGLSWSMAPRSATKLKLPYATATARAKISAGTSSSSCGGFRRMARGAAWRFRKSSHAAAAVLLVPTLPAGACAKAAKAAAG